MLVAIPQNHPMAAVGILKRQISTQTIIIIVLALIVLVGGFIWLVTR